MTRLCTILGRQHGVAEGALGADCGSVADLLCDLLTSLGLAGERGGEVGCSLRALPALVTSPLGGLSHLFHPAIFLCL